MKKILIILLIAACCVKAESDSPNESIEVLKQKAESGDPDSQYQLAIDNVSGKRIQKNDSAAFELFLKSALQGNPKAKYKVALAYFNGEGVEKNKVSGLAWMYFAVEDGIPDSQVKSMEDSLNYQDILDAKALYRLLKSKTIQENTSNVSTKANFSEMMFKISFFFRCHHRLLNPWSPD